MRKVILQEFVSLDGYAAGPNGDVAFIPASTKGDQRVAESRLSKTLKRAPWSWKPAADTQGLANYSRRFADSSAHYPTFVAKLKDLWLHDPTPAELGPPVLARVKAPTLVIDGDHGSARLEHSLTLFRNLPNAELLIVPGTGHNTLGEHPEWLNPIILNFLDRSSAVPAAKPTAPEP